MAGRLLYMQGTIFRDREIFVHVHRSLARLMCALRTVFQPIYAEPPWSMEDAFLVSEQPSGALDNQALSAPMRAHALHKAERIDELNTSSDLVRKVFEQFLALSGLSFQWPADDSANDNFPLSEAPRVQSKKRKTPRLAPGTGSKRSRTSFHTSLVLSTHTEGEAGAS